MVASRLGGACTTIRRPGGLRFGDVISSRIVRDGLARIEFVWIVPGWARIARAEVDLGEQTWNFVSRPRGEPPGAVAYPARGGAIPGRLFWVCPGSFPGGDMMMARPRGVSWA